MSKWYSKDGNTMVDLDKIGFYHYDTHNGGIDVLIYGKHVYLSGDDAKDLYEILKQPLVEKNVING